MTQTREALLNAINAQLYVSARDQNLSRERLEELRKDPGVVEYYRLREADQTGIEAMSYTKNLSAEAQSALIVFNLERSLLRTALSELQRKG